ncbi:PilN domain-containing protein [Chamaesiphon minutus]|uniref:Tfp pilus assembly protein PilN n=1 Tax=Chamaesiphon minutus (strain ATCC 27169 / PCC 6605) TaxID=1173020 RepID=K9UML6_CHAP6|nr:PilN domain-containing protein [Chamaesiphon minutus]AFY96332.1 Tfp pilus assembly protein PilN [Chamaesiphon minutus PCC 6605]
MYSLDINLLRERTDVQTDRQTDYTSGTNVAPAKYGKLPLFAGIGVAALTLMASGGGWLLLGQQTTQLEAKQQELDRKLGSLKVQDARLQELNGQIAQVNDETQSLASVFNQVQPLSAILQDLRESIPQGVQIATISQTESKIAAPTATAAAPAAPSGGLINKISTPPNPEATPKPGAAPTPASSPATVATAPSATTPTPGTPVATLPADIPTTKIEIVGTAKSFDEVNNFVLTLKQSAFFNPDDTQLASANLSSAIASLTKQKIDKPKDEITPAEQNALDRVERLELPKVVEYKIQTSIKRIPAADLIRELERKGAVGLVTRLKSLQQQQVIKP